jgi:integrase
VQAVLSRLVTKDRVAAATQNQALSALLFLYRVVLNIQLPWMEHIRRAKVPERLPVVLSRAEVAALLGEWCRDVGLQARLLYGCGIRRMECLRLRIQDLRFERHEIVVPGGKGKQDRITCCRRNSGVALGTGRGSPAHPPGGLPGGLWAGYPMLSRASIRIPIASWAGNTGFRLRSARPIRPLA